MPRETRVAIGKMQLQLSVNTLLSMLEDSQSLQLSALALAALAQLLVGLTEDDIDVMRMRWAAASQTAAWQQAAEQQPPAGQQQAAEHQQVPTPCGPDQQQTGADEEQQHCQSPNRPPKQQQAASPRRAAKRTLKAYRRQLDEEQAQPQEIVDEPLKVDRLLRALAPYVAACIKRPGLFAALDRHVNKPMTVLEHVSAHLFAIPPILRRACKRALHGAARVPCPKCRQHASRPQPCS
jgi:hypothetical protein